MFNQGIKFAMGCIGLMAISENAEVKIYEYFRSLESQLEID